jgi:hypothetical protein
MVYEWSNGLPAPLIQPKKNILPDNFANGGEDGTTDGIGGTSASCTCVSSTEQAHQGSRSLKVTFNGGASFEGVWIRIPIPDSFIYYGLSFWVKGTAGKNAGMGREWKAADGTTNVDSGTTNITLDGSWQQISVVRCAEIAGAKFLLLTLSNGGVMESHTVYFDEIQMERGTAVTDWTIENGSPKNLLPFNVANGTEDGAYSDFFDNNTTETLSSDTTEYWQGSHSLKCVMPGGAAWQGYYLKGAAQPTIPANTWVSCSVYFKGTAGKVITLYVQEYNTSGGYLNTQSATATTLSSSWQRATVTFQTSSVPEVIFLQPQTSTDQGAFTFYSDGFQIELGDTVTDWSVTDLVELYEWSLGLPYIITDEITASVYPYTLTATQHLTHIDLSWS